MFFTLASFYVFSQTTYHWNNPSGGNFTTAGNWTPNRSAPASNDILVFSTGGGFTVTNVPNQTIGQLRVENNTNVLFNTSTAGNILTISGGTGIDFEVQAGSALGLRGTNQLIIELASGATGEIYGIIGAGATMPTHHRFLATDASSLRFKSGAKCVAATGFTGNMFGNTGTSNTVIFEAGSEYICQDGGNPFGLAAPNSKVIFQYNSKYIHNTALVSPATSGRAYAIFELDHPSFNTPLTGSSSFNVQKFIVKQGNLRLGHSAAVNVSEDILILSGTSERTNSGVLNVGTQFVLNGGNFNYTGTGALSIGGNLEVQSASSTFNLSPVISSGTRNDVIGGNISNSGGTILFSPTVTPPNYNLTLQSTLTTPQSITNTGTLTFGPAVMLTLSDADGYVLNSHVTVQGILNLPAGGGKINANGNTLTLGINDAVPGALVYTFGSVSSYIYNGKFRRWFAAGASTNEVTGGFPIGIVSDIQPCAVKMTTAPTVGGYITAEFKTGYAGNLGLPLNVTLFDATNLLVNRVYCCGYYEVNADASLAGYTYTFRMVGNNYVGVADYTKLALLKRANSLSAWTAPGTQGVPMGSVTQFSLELLGLTSFSDFIVGANDVPNPLPVLFKQVSLQRSNHQNYLSWIVENPQEIQNFEIEKSYDAQQFFSVHTINSIKSTVYDYIDAHETSTKIFYRIKANLINGSYVLSDVLELNINPHSEIQLYQNPLQSNLKLMVESDNEQTLKVHIYDVSGKKVFESLLEVQRGNQIFTIETESFTAGMYVLHTQLNDKVVSFKIVK